MSKFAAMDVSPLVIGIVCSPRETPSRTSQVFCLQFWCFFSRRRAAPLILQPNNNGACLVLDSRALLVAYIRRCCSIPKGRYGAGPRDWCLNLAVRQSTWDHGPKSLQCIRPPGWWVHICWWVVTVSDRLDSHFPYPSFYSFL